MVTVPHEWRNGDEPRLDVVAALPGTEQARAVGRHVSDLQSQGVEVRVVARGRVLRQFVESLLPLPVKRDTVLSYRRYVNGLWGAVLGIPPVELDQYRTDLEEFVRRIVTTPRLSIIRVPHLVVLQGQELPPEFYGLLRLLGVPSTVFVDPTTVVGEEGTTVEEVCGLFGGSAPILLDRTTTTAQIHEFSDHFRLGPKRLSCALPERQGPPPTLTHHDTVRSEALDVLGIVNGSASRRIAVVLPTSELVSEFRNVLSPHLGGRLQWYLSGEEVRYDERVDAERAGLRILTWASACALDFDTVVLAGLQDVTSDGSSTTFRTMIRALASTARSELRLSHSGEGVPDVVRGLPHHLLALGSAVQLQLESTHGDEEQDPADRIDVEDTLHPNVCASGGQIAAARALIMSDRFRRRPDKRVLEADEEVGLAQLTRGEDRSLTEILPPGFRATLRPDDQRAVAFDTMIAHNLGLAHAVSRKYTGLGLDEEDLFQHGLIGLMRAVERFDATKGYKFSTYATLWLKQRMRRALADESRTIRLPNHKHDQVRKVQVVRAKLHGTSDVVTVADISRETDLSASVVVECLRLALGTFSLDAPVAEDLTLNDLFLDHPDRSSDLDLVLDTRSTSRVVHQAVRMLDARLARVIGLRFGLDGGEPLTLEEIGQLVGVTRERIRQIEKKAKEQLSKILTEVVTASGDTVIQVSPPTRSHIGHTRSRKENRALRSRHETPRPERVAEGSDLARLLGAVRPPIGLAPLLVAVVEHCVVSEATAVRVEIPRSGDQNSLTIAHNGLPFVSSVFLALGDGFSGEVSSGSGKVVGALCNVFDEFEVCDGRRDVQPYHRLRLTQAPRTNSWWLHGDDATRPEPSGNPRQGDRFHTKLTLRRPRPETTWEVWDDAVETVRATLGLLLGGLLESGRLRLSVSGVSVERRDPFLWSNLSSQDLGTELLYTHGSPILVTPNVLPHPDQLRPGDEANAGSPSSWEATQGFYVRCGGRYLSCSGWLGLPGLESTEDTALARVLVEVPLEERHRWGLDREDTQLRVPEELRARMRDLAVLARNRSELVLTHPRRNRISE